MLKQALRRPTPVLRCGWTAFIKDAAAEASVSKTRNDDGIEPGITCVFNTKSPRNRPMVELGFRSMVQMMVRPRAAFAAVHRCPVRLAWSRTQPFQGCDTGSNPVRDVCPRTTNRTSPPEGMATLSRA